MLKPVYKQASLKVNTSLVFIANLLAIVLANACSCFSCSIIVSIIFALVAALPVHRLTTN